MLGIHRFDRFLPLHYLWMDYMSELLNLPPPPSVPGPSVDDTPLPGGSSMHAKLVKADLHGSILSGKLPHIFPVIADR